MQNKIINTNLNQSFEALSQKFEALQVEKDLNVYFDKLEPIKNSLRDLCQAEVFIKSLSKENIIALVSIQSKIRFMADHSFYLIFKK